MSAAGGGGKRGGREIERRRKRKEERQKEKDRDRERRSESAGDVRGGYAASPIRTAGPGAPQWRPPRAAAFIWGGGARVMSPRRRARSGSSGRALRARGGAGAVWPGLAVAREMSAVLRMCRQRATYDALSYAERRDVGELRRQPHRAPGIISTELLRSVPQYSCYQSRRAEGSVAKSSRGQPHRAPGINPTELPESAAQSPGFSPAEPLGSVIQSSQDQSRRIPGISLTELLSRPPESPSCTKGFDCGVPSRPRLWRRIVNTSLESPRVCPYFPLMF